MDDRHRWKALALLVRAAVDLEAAGEASYRARSDGLARKILDVRCLVRDVIHDSVSDLNFDTALGQIKAAGKLLPLPFTHEEH
jgi:hypothetical protein